MHPGVAGFYALIANMIAGGLNGGQRREVSAGVLFKHDRAVWPLNYRIESEKQRIRKSKGS